MNQSIVRLQQIKLENFKNVKYGIAEMQSYRNKEYFSCNADILGVYGQNGSGKTSLVDAVQLLQIVLTGQPLPRHILDYISFGEDFAKLSYIFSVTNKIKKFLVYYSFIIKKEEVGAFISEESLQVSVFKDGSKEAMKDIIVYQYDDIAFLSKMRYKELLKVNKKNAVELEVAKKLSFLNKTSFVFGSEGFEFFVKSFREKHEEYSDIIRSLKLFALGDLIVINNRNSSMNTYQTFVFRIDENNRMRKGAVGIDLNDASIIKREIFEIVDKVIKQMNIVLSAIIPGFTIEIRNYGEQSLNDGGEGIKVELMSIRDSRRIPLRCESEGIKKIVSILHSVIQMYNDEKICVVVDELDAGIFEYLLGEILFSLEAEGKGQFIFTSHNLRALEKLNSKSILFTTVNPCNRYIRFSNVKNSNNLRDLFIRTINLGGQNEELYEETDTYEIRRAFRLAGKEMNQ